MIRLAFLGVFLIGGLIAFGAFYLVRGSESDIPEAPVEQVDAQTETPTTPVPEATPDVEEPPKVEAYYFLRELDLGDGEISLTFFSAAGETLLVRDADAIYAARDTAFSDAAAIELVPAGTLPEITFGISPRAVVGMIFSDGALLYLLKCIERFCSVPEKGPVVEYAGLLDGAVPIQRVEDNFDSYDDYLATIEAINTDPNYMLLNMRPYFEFPQPKGTSTMEIALPTVIVSNTGGFDSTAHEILVATALSSVLPEGATTRNVTITNLGAGLVGDRDNNAPVLAGGAPMRYPDVSYFSVSALIDGAAALDQSALDTLAQQTTDQYNFETEFGNFVRDRMQSNCVDCFLILVEGGVHDDARIPQTAPETYELVYYDLRDTP